MHSNFQGVVITPLAGGVDIIPHSGFFFGGGGRGRFFFNSKKEFKELFFRIKNEELK